MAKRNHTSKNPPSSNHADSSGSANALPTAEADPAKARSHQSRQALHELIESERSRLSLAQSMLDCLHIALENPDDSNANRQVYYPDIVEIVRDIVRESVNRLDSLYIRPLVAV